MLVKRRGMQTAAVTCVMAGLKFNEYPFQNNLIKYSSVLINNFKISALYIVFGSLYLDEVTLEPLTVTSVLAAATLFQLDGLIDRCIEVMTETTNAEVRKQPTK